MQQKLRMQIFVQWFTEITGHMINSLLDILQHKVITGGVLKGYAILVLVVDLLVWSSWKCSESLLCSLIGISCKLK
jgi:hypothetical protein